MMKTTKLLSAQIQYFNEQVKNDLSAEQIAVVTDYFDGRYVGLAQHLKGLLTNMETTHIKIINASSGICYQLDMLTCLNIYSIISKLSFQFYSKFEHLHHIHSTLDEDRLSYPIPYKLADSSTNLWIGVQLTRRLAYIDWLTRQFKLMINHLES